MIHRELYSIISGEYRSQRIDNIGEWMQSGFEIHNTEYSQLARIFNPITLTAVCEDLPTSPPFAGLRPPTDFLWSCDTKFFRPKTLGLYELTKAG